MVTTIASCVAQHTLPNCNIMLFGKQTRHSFHSYNGSVPGYQIASLLGAQPNRVCRIIAPSNEHGTGFKRIYAPEYEREVFAEGAVLTKSPCGAFLEHADCPALILNNTHTGEVLVTHAGRPALTPSDGENIVTIALDKIARRNEIDKLMVYITGSICGTHFPNEYDDARTHAERILEEFGPEVFTDIKSLAFSPTALITTQLRAAGLKRQQITTDGLCTYNHDELTSHRRHVQCGIKRTTCNVTVVATH